MDQISKLNAALVSVPQELTVAAANFNLDFSLMKVEAPKEFLGVGDSLSDHRRGEAEEGQSHITARKLGALFESLVPPVPNLYQAYGRRASSISSRSKSKWSSGLDSRIFAAQAGPDGTSIWAAATSGRGAIAVHLLACMLARIWKSHEAISLWVELVDRRKQEIVQQYDTTNAMEIGSLMASKQTFSRQQLASWDASARSWLQTADSDRRLQQTQLMLIISNVRLPVNSKKDPYESVIDAWVSGMAAMNRLLQGIPQRVQDGTILLAMSSWHLYPDMEVLLDDIKHIKQHDELLSESLITICAQPTSHNKEGVFWSLPLARMRYYSAPVTAERHIASNNSRVTIDAFWLIALGAIIDQWSPAFTNTTRACDLVIRLSQIVNEPNVNLKWLKYLSDAAHKLKDGNEIDRLQSGKLLRLGMRWCRTVLNDPHEDTPVFFGLHKFATLLEFLPKIEDRISVLREVGTSLGVSSDEMLIRYPEWQHWDARSSWLRRRRNAHIFATVLLPTERSNKPSGDAVHRSKRQRREATSHHARWIVAPEPTSAYQSCDDDCPCVSQRLAKDMMTVESGSEEEAGLIAEIKLCPCSSTGRGCTSSCHKHGHSGKNCTFWNLFDGEVSCEGPECGCTIPDGPPCPCAESGSICTTLCHMNRDSLRQCDGSRSLLQASREKLHNSHPCSIDQRCAGCVLSRSSQPVQNAGEDCFILRSSEIIKIDDCNFMLENDSKTYQFHVGNIDDAAIFVATGTTPKRESRTGHGMSATVDEIERILSHPSLDSEALMRFLSKDQSQMGQQRRSLHALEFATDLYNTLPGATVSVEAADRPLSNASWAQSMQVGQRPRIDARPPSQLKRFVSTRKQIFSPVTEVPNLPSTHQSEYEASTPESAHSLESLNYDSSTNHKVPVDLLDTVLAYHSSYPDLTIPPPNFMNENGDRHQNSLEESPFPHGTPRMQSPSANEISEAKTKAAVSFACLAMMETGEFDIDPKQLIGVVALSSGDSIFVVSDMISDPYCRDAKPEIRRVFGNLGRPELAFLLPPSKPMIESYDINSWHLVNHFSFNGDFEDKFQNTSLHLSFTDFELPIDVGHRGLRDTLVVLLESVVEVNDGGTRVGDLDINSMSQSIDVKRAPKCTNKAHPTTVYRPAAEDTKLKCIDSWVELLDFPDTVGIFRAKGNWQARLAATAASLQLRKRVVILPPNPCHQCLQAMDKTQVDVIVA